MREDFTKIYAVTDEKYKEEEFNKKLKKKIKCLQKELK